MKAWYLVYCKSKNEERAKLNLMMQGVEVYLPLFKEEKLQKGKIVEKTSPLFPSYLFICFDPTEFSVSKIHSTRGVVRLVGCSENSQPIDPLVIEAIKCRDHSIVKKVEVEFVSGDKICFREGPFAALEGVFEERCGNSRCQVLFTIMGQQQRMAVSPESLQKISA